MPHFSQFLQFQANSPSFAAVFLLVERLINKDQSLNGVYSLLLPLSNRIAMNKDVCFQINCNNHTSKAKVFKFQRSIKFSGLLTRGLKQNCDGLTKKKKRIFLALSVVIIIITASGFKTCHKTD